MTTLKKLTVLLLCIFTISACDDDNPVTDIQTNLPVFNLDNFEQNLIDYTNTGQSPVGWAYTININGVLQRSNAFGEARTGGDGSLNFTTNKEINTASITKFYTAIAVMQLLEANNLTIEDNIAEWLPDSWDTDDGVSSLTFKDMLKHESGLNSLNSDFDNTLSYQGIKDCIAEGVVNSQSRNYLNVNFAIFRIIIPSLWSALNNSPNIDIESDSDTQDKYLQYMQQFIFDPLNLNNVNCTAESRTAATLYYNINDPGTNANGRYYGDWDNKCGGGGYYMTIIEMAKVNAFFEHTETLVSSEARTTMKEHRLGMDTADIADEIHGNYYGKNGSIGTSSDATISQGVIVQTVMFPSVGVDCVVVINNQGNTFNSGGTSLRQMIYDAFNNSYE